MLGEKTDGETMPCALVALANREKLADPFTVACPQSRRNDGFTDAPPERMLSAYQTLVPERSTLDSTRCASSPDAASEIATSGSTTSRVTCQPR